MEKWIVNITEAQLEHLSDEQRNLGTLLKDANGDTILVFRDGFVALKIAAQLGAQRLPGRSFPATQASSFTPMAHFDNGDVLVAERA